MKMSLEDPPANGETTDNNVSFKSVVAAQDAQEELSKVKVDSHFSMRQSRCVTVDHKHNHIHVINQRSKQIILEEVASKDNDSTLPNGGEPIKLRVKTIRNSRTSINVARGIFVMVGFLLTAFHFVFSLDALLHVSLSILSTLYREDDTVVSHTMAILKIFSIPVFLHSFATITTVTFSLLHDTWEGLPYFNTRWNPEKQVTTHWIYTSLIIFVPSITYCVSSFYRSPDTWSYTILSALCAMEFFFFFYLLDAAWVKTNAAMFISRKFCYHRHNPWAARLRRESSGSDDGSNHSILKRLWFLCVTRVQLTYAVRRRIPKVLNADERQFFTRARFESTNDGKNSEYDDSLESEEQSQSNDWGRNSIMTVESARDVDPKLQKFDSEEISDALKCCGTKWWESTVLEPFVCKVEPAQKLLSIDEITGVRRFTTNVDWNISSLLCVRERRGSVAVLRGPGQLHAWRMKHSLAFSIVGLIVIGLVLGAVFYSIVPVEAGPAIWAGMFLIAVMVLLIYYWLTRILPEYQEKLAAMKSSTVGFLEVRPSTTLVVACVSHNTAAVLFLIGTILFYFMPFIALLITPNLPLALLFLACALLSAHSYVFNLHELLSMRGEGGLRDLRNFVTLKVVRHANNPRKHKSFRAESKESKMKEAIRSIEARVDIILRDLANTSTWQTLLASMFVCTAILAFLLVASLLLDDSIYTENNTKNISFMNSTYYTPDALGRSIWEKMDAQEYNENTNLLPNSMEYPVCSFSGRRGFENTPSRISVTDFAFLAHLAYVQDDDVQRQLDEWFGVDQVNVTHGPDLDMPPTRAVVKLFQFKDANMDVVSVRGTTTAVDALIDMQLWNAALFLQVTRAMLPLGTWVWTPALPALIEFIGALETVENNQVAYYTSVSELVRRHKAKMEIAAGTSSYLKARQLFITGHSLGGGIAMISGAQTQTNAIGISGVNSMLSRKRFTPKVTKEQLDQYTFNIIPDRDPVPRIDDVARQRAHVRCQEDSTDIDCHTLLRTICELQDKCGSNFRPVPCHCHLNYGYDKPRNANETANFEFDFKNRCGLNKG